MAEIYRKEVKEMINFGKWVVKHRVLILIIAVVLLIPSAIGYVKTRVNYDILTYLPKEIDTMKGQDIMVDEFKTGAFSMCVVEGMSNKDVSELRKQMKEVKGVKDVIWYDSFVDLSIPMDLLPDRVKDAFINKEADSTIMFVLFPTSLSDDDTLNAISDLRKIMNKQCFLLYGSQLVLQILHNILYCSLRILCRN